MAEMSYVVNTFFLLMCGCLVMFMAVGFAMLEAGSVRSKSVGVILVKNVGIYAIAGIMFYLIGYNLMYKGVDGGFFGTPSLWVEDDSAALKGDYTQNYASAAGWFFQMVFVATAASIVSGALAERIKIWPFFFFSAVLCAIIYPIVGAWTWGGGFLAEMGFKDFAGSTIVHSVGGWAALTGAIILGARRGRFNDDGRSRELPKASLPLATLGTLILWFGWFGFNGGSQLAIASTADAIAVGKILINTNMAAAAGTFTMFIYYHLMKRPIDLTMILNGALAGLVAITAEPLTPSPVLALIIGATGAMVMLLISMALEKARIDDVVGAIPVHLGAGIWGTLVVPVSNPDAHIMTQLAAVTAVGVFVTLTSLGLWLALKATVSIRLHWSHEDMGSDLVELGCQAHNLNYGR